MTFPPETTHVGQEPLTAFSVAESRLKLYYTTHGDMLLNDKPGFPFFLEHDQKARSPHVHCMPKTNWGVMSGAKQKGGKRRTTLLDVFVLQYSTRLYRYNIVYKTDRGQQKARKVIFSQKFFLFLRKLAQEQQLLLKLND